MRWKTTVVPAAALWLAAMFVAVCSQVDIAAQARRGAEYFSNVTLTTQDGETVRFYDDLLKDKIVAINLIYTTCQYACPLETARLSQVQRKLGDRMGRDIFFYSITIDPEHDTPAVLKEYSEKFHAGPGWKFLTGKKEDIDLISRRLGLYTPPDPGNADGDMPYLLVGNERTGQWMRNSAVDNAGFIATTIGDWLNSWQTKSVEPSRSYSEVPARLTLDRGQYTFANHCAACHTIGGGEHFGPDLAGVTARRDHDWLVRFIFSPQKLREAGDPIALALRAKYTSVVMPNLDLGTDDAKVLIEYIERESGKAGEKVGTTGAAPATAAPASPRAVSMKTIVEPYLRVQTALNLDDLAGARAAAAEAAKLSAAGTAVQGAAAAIERAADLKAARAAFASFGDALMKQAKDSSALGDDVKVAYCPMVQKYWLQKGEKIRNPFYGQEMSECGRLSESCPEICQGFQQPATSNKPAAAGVLYSQEF
jgi:protein SCO1